MCYTALNGGMCLMNRKDLELIVAYFEVLSQYLSEEMTKTRIIFSLILGHYISS
jgi:hypothetical protein